MSCNSVIAAAARSIPCQDTGASSSIVGGTILGGNTAAELTTTGPGKGWPNAFAFDGSADYISLTSFNGTGSYGFACWVNAPNAQLSSNGGLFRANNTGLWINQSSGRLWGRQRAVDVVSSAAGPVLQAAGWTHVACDFNVGTSTYKLYINGTLFATKTSVIGDESANHTFVAVQASDNYLRGDAAGFLFNSGLSEADAADLYAGLEPTYTSGATLSDAGAWNVGTWDSYSNGSLTYSVVAAEADGTPVDTGSGATGTLDLSSAAGELVYLYVRASNNGGYDVGDFSTIRIGDYGSAGDGYYEVASVTAAGGGGSALPAIVHHYRQLMTA